jgi:hypothetical protein
MPRGKFYAALGTKLTPIGQWERRYDVLSLCV